VLEFIAANLYRPNISAAVQRPFQAATYSYFRTYKGLTRRSILHVVHAWASEKHAKSSKRLGGTPSREKSAYCGTEVLRAGSALRGLILADAVSTRHAASKKYSFELCARLDAGNAARREIARTQQLSPYGIAVPNQFPEHLSRARCSMERIAPETALCCGISRDLADCVTRVIFRGWKAF